MDLPHEDSTREDRSLEAVIAAYLRASRAGRVPDRAEYLARYPELAGELESFFAEYEAFDRIASPIRAVQLRKDDRSTALDPSRVGFGDFELVRLLGSGGWESSTRPSRRASIARSPSR